MSYELIDSEKLNKLILSIETLNELVKKLSNKSWYEKKSSGKYSIFCLIQYRCIIFFIKI